MRTADFDYDLPEELIAQRALEARDQSRLLVLDRSNQRTAHQKFKDFADYLHDTDLLVLNNSKVIRARLRGVNARSGGKFELLLIQEVSTNNWWTMVKPGKRARGGTRIVLNDCAGIPTPITAHVLEINEEGHRHVYFEGTTDIFAELSQLGEIPLPPYIDRHADESDADRYQTVFAQSPGSVAAPTAGLHFTHETLAALNSRGIQTCEVTLHVGLGTFAPVKADSLEGHVMHEERYRIPEETACLINSARQEGRRIVAIGTTTLRTLESAADATSGTLQTGSGRTRLFVRPPHRFRIVDVLLTNFHLPRSTLLMLVSAFASPEENHGRELILSAYAEAVRERYRFFSYGDAMLIL